MTALPLSQMIVPGLIVAAALSGVLMAWCRNRYPGLAPALCLAALVISHIMGWGWPQ